MEEIMTINLSVPTQTTHQLQPRITVVGVGGGGCNAVNNMIDAGLQGVDFLVANTDGQSLKHSKAERKVQLGAQLTGGLGAGSKPEIGEHAALESLETVMSELSDCNMVFITAGMGGGTGTGAAPIIAKATREQGILTVGVVTKPFEFEGKRRMQQAEEGVRALQEVVDTLIVIPNQNLFTRANDQTRFTDAFGMADTVLHQGVSGVTDLIIKPGLINLDFADIKSVMLEMGKAMMGTGEASGEKRAQEAAEAAINNPLLDHSSMHGASALLINITGGMDMTLFEVDEAANRVKQEIDEDATIVFGTAFDESMDDIMRVSVVATGIDADRMKMRPDRNLHTPVIPAMQPHIAASAPAPDMPIASQTAPPVMAMQAETAETAQSAPTADNLAGNLQDTEQEQTGLSAEQPEQMDIVAVAEARTRQAQSRIDEIQADADHMPEQSDATEAGPSAEQIAAPVAEQSDATEAEAETQAGAGADNTISAQPDSQPELVLGSHNEARIIRNTGFTPRPAQPISDSQAVPETAPVPAASRPSLINRISNLWTGSPETSSGETSSQPDETASREEPVLKQSDAVLPHVEEPPIMDLPKVDMVQTSLPVEQAKPDTHSDDDDDMDIPAFLRRQAN